MVLGNESTATDLGEETGLGEESTAPQIELGDLKKIVEAEVMKALQGREDYDDFREIAEAVSKGVEEEILD